MSRFLARARGLLHAEPHTIARTPPRPPAAVDLWLNRQALTLAGILNMGGTARPSPDGGLDVWRADGRYLGISPALAREMRAAGLLHPTL